MKALKDKPSARPGERRSRRGVAGNLTTEPATQLNKLLPHIFPSGFRPTDVVALFEHRTTYGTIKQWRHGRRNMPAWAVEIIRAKFERGAELIAGLKAGPGGDGSRYLAAWRVKQSESNSGF